MDPFEILRSAGQNTESGEYAAALDNYVWLHEQSLNYAPEFIGVRRTYVIHGWVSLGAIYPPARVRLLEVAEATKNRLLGGDDNGLLFADFAAINKHIGAPEATCELFFALEERLPHISESCKAVALPILRANGYADRY